MLYWEKREEYILFNLIDGEGMGKASRGKTVMVGIVGGKSAGDEALSLAEDLGRRIAREGYLLVTGGGPGIMEAASRGAFLSGGLVIGILPADRTRPVRGYPNEYVNVPIHTGLSDARNAVIAKSSDVIVALGGGYGTVSEVALALKNGTPVIAVSCPEYDIFRKDKHFIDAMTANEVMEWIKRLT